MSKDDDTGPRSSKKGWDDLIFGAIDRLASTSEKLKDPQIAFDWLKGLREDLQDRIKEEVSKKISKLDFQDLSRRTADHLAQNYKLKVSATFEWEPKNKNESASPSEESPSSS